MMNAEFETMIIKTLEGNKAREITKLDVSSITTAMDIMLICTATSKRHAKSIAEKVVETAKHSGVKLLGIEGEQFGEWILIDLNDLVVHIMLEEQRQFYSLEKLWTATENIRKQGT